MDLSKPDNLDNGTKNARVFAEQYSRILYKVLSDDE